MVSTSGLCNWSGEGSTAGSSSTGPRLPVFQPQGRRSFQVRPCERKSGQKALNWNQRTYSSAVSSLVEKKPPVSVPQYGMPLSPVLSASAICARSVDHCELVSPDQRKP